MAAEHGLEEPILVWRNVSTDYLQVRPSECVYCQHPLQGDSNYPDLQPRYSVECPFCGWGYELSWVDDDGETYKGTDYYKVLRTLSLNSAELSLGELGEYLRKHPEKVDNLDPRRFELLVGDVFRNHGFRVTITKQTHDGGYDLILLDNDREKALVEVKRYRCPVGVDLVRQLRGVQLRENVSKAVLVTSGRFTNDARCEAGVVCPYGFELELVDAEILLKMFDVYRDGAPCLADAIKTIRDRQ